MRTPPSGGATGMVAEARTSARHDANDVAEVDRRLDEVALLERGPDRCSGTSMRVTLTGVKPEWRSGGNVSGSRERLPMSVAATSTAVRRSRWERPLAPTARVRDHRPNCDADLC